MKIQSVTNSYKPCNYPISRVKVSFGTEKSDVFIKSSEYMFPLKKITAQTAEKLYRTNYTPISEPKEGYYLTYALDKETLKPVDIYVKKIYDNFRNPKRPWLTEEKYCFYRKISDGSLKLAGERRISINMWDKKISSGYMETRDKTLTGLGLRGHQLAIERMLELGYDDVDIISVQDAYDFHKKAGFETVDQYIYRDGHLKAEFIKNWAEKLGLPDETMKKMIVCDPDDISMLNINKTTENCMLYLKKEGRKIGEELGVLMSLPKNALNEWINMAKLKPILLK